MYKKLLLIGGLLAIIFFATGCGIPQEDYDKLKSDKYNFEKSANATIADLRAEISTLVKPPKFFENRTTIQNWLNSVHKLGVSKDVEQWFQYALFYQQKALDAGYKLSVSYAIVNKKVSITCDIFTVDGYLYYFNPDDCILEDAEFRIDMPDIEYLEIPFRGSLQ
jgi:hypothetical protein